jgi:hypothetical protein
MFVGRWCGAGDCRGSHIGVLVFRAYLNEGVKCQMMTKVINRSDDGTSNDEDFRCATNMEVSCFALEISCRLSAKKGWRVNSCLRRR